MDRRGFLKGILAACVAPYVVKSGVLMPVKEIIVPELAMGHGTELTLAEELTIITRRAFVPKMVVQIYSESPTMAELLRQ